MLAGIAEFHRAARVANIGVVNHQMDRLIVVVLCAGVIDIGQFVERELTISFNWTEHVLASVSACWQIVDVLQTLMACMAGVFFMQTSPEGDLLQRGMEHPLEHPILEALMEVADLP